jgi:hypothetical protein
MYRVHQILMFPIKEETDKYHSNSLYKIPNS